MFTETSRVPDPNNPNITMVTRVGNGEFQFVKEVQSSTTELIVDGDELHTEETITINRYISKVAQFQS